MHAQKTNARRGAEFWHAVGAWYQTQHRRTKTPRPTAVAARLVEATVPTPATWEKHLTGFFSVKCGGLVFLLFFFLLSAFFSVVCTRQHALEQLRPTVTRLTGINGLHPLKRQRIVGADVTCEIALEIINGKRKKQTKKASPPCPGVVYSVHFLFLSRVKGR